MSTSEPQTCPPFTKQSHSTDFTEYDYVPVGVIVATCTTPKSLPTTTRTSPKLIVHPGKLLSYTIRFRNTDTVNALTGVKVVVSLPPQVSLLSALTFPYPRPGGKARAAGRLGDGGVVTWTNITIGAKKRRAFRVRTRVSANTPGGTAISFGCTLYQTNASPNGDSYCPQKTRNMTVSDLGDRGALSLPEHSN